MELGETQINSVWSIDLLWCVNRELDKTASSVSDAVLPLSLGNLGLLIADPTIDKTSLHSQIMHTYKWSARVSSLLCQLTSLPLPFSGQHLSNDDCLANTRLNCAVLCTAVVHSYMYSCLLCCVLQCFTLQFLYQSSRMWICNRQLTDDSVKLRFMNMQLSHVPYWCLS